MVVLCDGEMGLGPRTHDDKREFLGDSTTLGLGHIFAPPYAARAVLLRRLRTPGSDGDGDGDGDGVMEME